MTGPDVGEPGAADRFIAEVSDAIEKMHFNVALARLMEFAPTARAKSSKDIFVRLLAPLAPHLAEELWHQLGHDGSVHETLWPEPDPAALLTPTVALVVQVDGKVKAVLKAPRGLTRDASTHLALQHERVNDALDARSVTRVVFVPDRVVNLVTRR